MSTTQNIDKYLELAKIEQLRKEYEEKGFTVKVAEKIGNFRADLVAKKKNDIVVVEVKSPLQEKNATIKKALEYAKKYPNVRFRLVVTKPPREKEIEIENIEEKIFEYMIRHNYLPDLPELSSSTGVAGVSDIDISAIEIEKNKFIITGEGTVDVDLQYSCSVDGQPLVISDSFPFEFRLVLNSKLEITDHKDNKLKIDTSSYE